MKTVLSHSAVNWRRRAGWAIAASQDVEEGPDSTGQDNG